MNQYDDLLEHIRDSMDKMEGKTVSIETVNLNNKKLLEALQDILKKLDLPYKYQTALQVNKNSFYIEINYFELF